MTTQCDVCVELTRLGTELAQLRQLRVSADSRDGGWSLYSNRAKIVQRHIVEIAEGLARREKARAAQDHPIA